MNKPVLSRPRLGDWRSTDEGLSKLLVSLEKEVLNIREWSFPNENNTKFFTYLQLLDLVNSKWIGADGQSVCKSLVRWLPDKLRVLNEDLKSLFKRYLLTIEEQTNLIGEFNAYCDFLEDDNKVKDEEIIRLKSENEALGTKKAVFEAESKLAQAEKIIKDLVPKPKAEVPEEKKIEKDVKKKGRSY